MKRKFITVEGLRTYCKEHGIPMTPKDDPVYDEGPTIIFLYHTLKKLKQKETELLNALSDSPDKVNNRES